MSFKTDAEIAQSSTMRPIGEIAAKLGLNADNIEPYGHYKAKINPAEAFKLPQKQGRLILVTAINPTPAGEGKTTVTIGLADALRHIGKDAVIALREPSRAGVRRERRRGRRRLCPSFADGRHQPALHRRFSRHRCGK